MIVSEIEKRLEVIQKLADEKDNELAHIAEHNLLLDFVKHVISNSEDPNLKEKARLVSSSQNIQFHRWFS